MAYYRVDYNSTRSALRLSREEGRITGRDWEVPLLRGRIGGIDLDEFWEMINWRIILYEIIFT